MSNGFGTPSYGNTTNFWKPLKLKSPDASKGEQITSLVALIVPPMKSLAEAGKWACYHGQHFGYSGVDPRNPDKTKMRPFACIEQTNYRSKMIEVECPACTEIRTKKEELDRREADFKAQGLREEQVRERLQPLNEWLKKHNADRKWHINVMTQDGEFGVLQISHTLKKSLDALIETLRTKRKVDPIMEGVWFEFTRMGKFPVQDAVKEVLIENAQDGSFKMKKTPLTDAQGMKALEILPDLAKETVKFISAQQIQLIVQSSGDPEEIDRIWQMGTKTEQKREVSAPRIAPVQERKAAPPVVAPNATAVDEEAELLGRLAALQAKKAAPAPAVLAEDAAPSAPVTPEEELTDEQFYDRYGVK